MIKINTRTGFRSKTTNSILGSTRSVLNNVHSALHSLKGLIAVAVIGFSLSFSLGISAANPVLADNYPERYTVVKGDTLWDISSRFLQSPWRWPEVWQGNPQVENPDLIYPGDVLVMTFIDGKPVLRALRRETVKLSPKARPTSFVDSIPPIDPSAIQAFINSPLVTDKKELLTAPYIVDGFDNRLVMGKYDKFYARGFNQKVAEKEVEVGEESEADKEVVEYRVFRRGRHFVDPATKESLGWEAEHVGDANMLVDGDPAKLVFTKTFTDASIKDRLRPVYKKEALPFFYPKAPSNADIRGVILDAPNRSTELGAMSVVAMNLGERENVAPGDVFRILSQGKVKKDPVTGEKYSTPEEKVGLAIVFRTFEKVSYALITDSERQVLPGDILVNPETVR